MLRLCVCLCGIFSNAQTLFLSGGGGRHDPEKNLQCSQAPGWTFCSLLRVQNCLGGPGIWLQSTGSFPASVIKTFADSLSHQLGTASAHPNHSHLSDINFLNQPCAHTVLSPQVYFPSGLYFVLIYSIIYFYPKLWISNGLLIQNRLLYSGVQRWGM